ncbi:MAG: 4-hydroxybenzoate decarboxylase, partial [Desulfobacterales bacterium]|nr:4-hydroxybenzoate decarboxylase [Desulfobacterales bacterium]
EAFACGLRILGEGQLSLTKFLIITDGPVDISNFRELWTHILERVNWQRDLFIFANVSQDTLDYTGPSVNKGSKALLMGLGPDKIRELPDTFAGVLPRGCCNPVAYMPGTLVVEGDSYESDADLAERLAEFSELSRWPVILLVDSSNEATCSMQEFLWTFFTRFEPAADIHGSATSVQRFHVGLEPPIVFDCRMKPWYTEVLEVDQPTRELVDEKFDRIIPYKWR